MGLQLKLIKFEIKDSTAYAGFGLSAEKSLTTLDEPTLKELKLLIQEVNQGVSEGKIKALVFHSLKDGVFLAGADIGLIASLKTEMEAAHGSELGQQLYNDIEDLKIPTLACVNGVCLGGGLELALACKSIIVSDSPKTSLGLPEVKLGILPGFGGTYRLPRKIGLPKSLDMILTGRTLNASKAKKMGLIEEVYPKERLLEMASKHFTKNAKKLSVKEMFEQLASDNFVSRKIIFQKAREGVLKKTKGFYQAPLKILDLMEAGMMKGRSAYLSMEAQAFGELCVSSQGKNLQHVFFLMDGSKKYQGPKGQGPIPKLKRGAVLGAGTMGGGIAWLMASSDMAPLMKDINSKALELGLKQSAENFMGALKRKKMTPEDFERKQRSISTQLDFRGFNRVDLVIEAIVEVMDIKKKVFAETEKYVREDCILTSNTSSLSVQEMSTALEKPQRFAGLHFFNPVHLMPLVEIIVHDKIAPETVEALYKWVLATKKTPVVVKDGPGFLVNRILMPYLNEAGHLLCEGVPMKEIEDACLNFGMPMGPCRLLDEIGHDVGVKVAKIIHEGLGDRAKPAKELHKLVEAGFLGKKSSKGLYLYDEKGKPTGPNEEALKLLPPAKKSKDEIDIQMRVFLPMINEAAYILEEGIVDRASDVDLGLIFGLGFPPFRGGLLRYADSEGPERILGAIERYSHSVDKDRYAVAPLLRKLVEKKQKFYEYSRS